MNVLFIMAAALPCEILICYYLNCFTQIMQQLFFLCYNVIGVSCGNLPLPLNSHLVGPIEQTGNRYEDTTKYYCIEGYEITNTSFNFTTITCQANMTWSALPYCSSKFG